MSIFLFRFFCDVLKQEWLFDVAFLRMRDPRLLMYQVSRSANLKNAAVEGEGYEGKQTVHIDSRKTLNELAEVYAKKGFKLNPNYNFISHDCFDS